MLGAQAAHQLPDHHAQLAGQAGCVQICSHRRRIFAEAQANCSGFLY
jgi:hypothetical protein